jgi:hypothetical protein
VKLVRLIDVDGDGAVTWCEFQAFLLAELMVRTTRPSTQLYDTAVRHMVTGTHAAPAALQSTRAHRLPACAAAAGKQEHRVAAGLGHYMILSGLFGALCMSRHGREAAV